MIKQIIYSEGDFSKPNEESVMFLKQQMLEILDQFTSSKKKIQNMAEESDSNHESDEDDDEAN